MKVHSLLRALAGAVVLAGSGNDELLIVSYTLIELSVE
jgi:hypothetical protein